MVRVTRRGLSALSLILGAMVAVAVAGCSEQEQSGKPLHAPEVDVDPAALPNWQFRDRTVKKIKRAVPASRTIECPYGPA
jgi:hypothetical protein